MRYYFLLISCFCFLSACSYHTGTYAPVTNISTFEPMPKNHTYRVMRDDTLYSIAWRYGLDYRDLAEINHIARPYHIEKGQILYLKEKGYHKTHFVALEPKPVVRVSSKGWHWPANGPLIGSYSESNKGINIGGKQGVPVFAAAAGKVVYSGNGLRGYGNMIIIKHNNVYLSAYAHNSENLVKEGEQVKAGQKIAKMGKTGSNRVMLHFEIRRNGQPVNPVAYLAERNH